VARRRLLLASGRDDTEEWGAPDRGGPLRRGGGDHQRQRLHREDRGRPAPVHL